MTKTIDIRTAQAAGTDSAKRKDSLKQRLLFLIGLGLVVSFFLIGLIATLAVRNAEQNIWQGRQANATKAAVMTADGFVDRIQSSLNLFALLSPNYLDETPEIVQEWLTQNNDVIEVVRLDAQGNLVAGAAQSDSLLFDPQTVLQSNWYLAATAGERSVGVIQFSADNQPYTILSQPTPNGGVVAARVRLNSLSDALAADQIDGQSGATYIIDSNGLILAHPNRQLVTEYVSLAGRPELTAILEAPSFEWRDEYTNLDNRSVIGVSTAMDSSDWIAISEVDRSEAVRMSRFTAIANTVGLLLFTAAALWAISRLLDGVVFGRINKLRTNVTRIGQGHTPEPIDVSRDDEIGELSNAFNNMVDALNVRDQRLDAQTQALAQEVLERKSAQENSQLVNAQLRQSSQYKDQFLATMSHELRTPLNAVLGMAEAMMVPVYGNLNDQQLKAMVHIRESGQHLLSLIDDILDLSKISAGKSPLDINPVWIDAVVKASLRFIQPVAAEKGLSIETRIDPSVSAIMADERRLKQMLVNLLSNAVKFTDKGGTVGLVIRGNAAEGKVDIIVHDTGIGIPDNAMNQLFEPFTQLDAGLARQYGGTGLGLALVQKLVDLHGGSIAVKSKVNVGSRFRITLPWVEPNAVRDSVMPSSELASSDAHIAIPLNGSKILLAEDREANIVTLRDYLHSRGFEVIVARNGIQAVEMTHRHHPHLILMDIQMPEMSGLEAIRLIRADEGAQPMPIVALTALAMPGDRERCLQAGANDYISKPVSLRQLLQVIETQLNRVPSQ